MSRGKSGPTSARARCGTTSPTHPMMPEVATLAEVTNVAAATIAIRNGPVASPSARASSSGNDITLSRQRSAISTMVPTATGPVAVGTIVLIALRWRLNVMSLPEDEARALGLATGPFRIAIVAAATLVTSASVATSGIIGWVGLVVPHLARALVGPDFPRLIPTAAL